MRVLLWPLCPDGFLKSDDALARGEPLSGLSLPNAQFELVFGPAEPVAAAPAQLPEPSPTQPRQTRPHPLARQLMVQRHLRRGPARKRAKTATPSKRRASQTPARRNPTLMNRPTSRKTTATGKKRRPPRRHVWLAARR